MSLFLWIPLLVPAACAAAAATRRQARWTRPLGLVSALVILVTGLGLLGSITAAGGEASTRQVTCSGSMRSRHTCS